MPVPDRVLRIEREGPRARVILARPDVRNAFNAELIARLYESFVELGADSSLAPSLLALVPSGCRCTAAAPSSSASADSSVAVIVLQGEGKAFCGGADINWMRDALALSEDDNLRDAAAMSDMLRAIDRCPKPVIARVHGAALAGGTGLCAVADAVIIVRGRRRNSWQNRGRR